MAALRPVFKAGGLTPREDEPTLVVHMGGGRKPVTVRFSAPALDAYMAGDEAFRARACKSVARVCSIRMALDYTALSDPWNPFVISASLNLQSPE